VSAARLLVSGHVALAATGSALRELLLDEPDGERWKIILATPEAETEAGDLVEGEAVAFVGLGDRQARRLMADRALNLRAPGAGDASAPTAGEHPFRTREAWDAALERLEHCAAVLGGVSERGRVMAIMNSPDAEGRLALAWRLAEAGLAPEAAREALLISKIESAAPSIDAGATLQH
jgi:hypothetical protein